jgi:hypothetical protein
LRGGKHTQRESSLAGRNLPEKFLSGGAKIIGIVTVIKLGFIGIIIIITSTFITFNCLLSHKVVVALSAR